VLVLFLVGFSFFFLIFCAVIWRNKDEYNNGEDSNDETLKYNIKRLNYHVVKPHSYKSCTKYKNNRRKWMLRLHGWYFLTECPKVQLVKARCARLQRSVVWDAHLAGLHVTPATDGAYLPGCRETPPDICTTILLSDSGWRLKGQIRIRAKRWKK